jgi:hypothetical protein
MAKLLSREAILNVVDIKTETVSVPEWGGDVMVKGLTGAERNDFEQSMLSRKGKDVQMNMKNATAKLCALSMVDEEGKRLFSDADVEVLGNKSGAALSRVYAVASRLSGLSDSDMKELTEGFEENPNGI